MEAGTRFIMFLILLFIGIYFIITSISCIVRMAILCHIEETLKESCDRACNRVRNIRTYRRRKRINPVIIEPIPDAIETNPNTPVVYVNAVRDAVVVESKEEEFDPLTLPTHLI